MSNEVGAPKNRSRVAPDRRRVSGTRLWVMTLLTGAMVWAALSSLMSGPNSRISSTTIAQASGIVAVLAIFGLRSVPVRWIVRGLALLSGALLARFGQLGATEGLAGSWRILVWLAAFGVALTLAPSSRSVIVDPVDPGPGGLDPEGTGSPGVSRAMAVFSDTRGRIPLAVAITVISFVGGIALLVGPRASNWFPTGARASDLVDRAKSGTDNVLVSRESLDMTSRPKLSDKVVMTVRSPIVSLWRAELFDRWDGATWTRTYANRGRIIDDGIVEPSADDIAGQRGATTVQQFRLESGYATVMPSAATPTRVISSNEVAQRIDGTLVSVYQALGSGTTYTIESRQMPLDQSVLRSAGSAKVLERASPVAANVMAQYAMMPATTDRVVNLARRITAGLDNDFDKILAIQRFMARNNTYSLDAPLSPRDVDVVDHFLFDQREGWCEQIASSLVVLARAVGVPARLATGYAPGEWDAAAGRFIVRERDAHAWAEVWFPGQGWVSFDPTASVPLSGTQAATAGADVRDWREVAGMVLVALGLVSVSAGPVSRFVQRVFTSVRSRRAISRGLAQRWELRAAQRLEVLGQRASGRGRGVSDSLTAYGGSLTNLTADDRFSRIGVLLDRELYGYSPPRDTHVDGGNQVHNIESETQQVVEELLRELESV